MTACPLDCGFHGDVRAHETAGVTIFVCPECLGVAFDGAILTDPRKPVDLSRVIRPVIVATVHENSVDPLTQVKNRRFFFARLATELRNARHRHYVSIAAFAFDIDAVYRMVGSRAGDTIIQSLAAVILTALRAGDNFARVEANVFGFILPNADAARARLIAERVLATANVYEFHPPNGVAVQMQLRLAVVEAGDDETPESQWTRALDEVKHGA